jgi:molecular chaperone DnaK (HSP70)
LLEAAEKAKLKLSAEKSARFFVSHGGREYRREFTRAEFDRLISPVLERTREPCLAALRDAGLEASQLSDVVMVGGPTRLEAVQAMARSIFGREPNTSVHPDEVVACGAAIQADILAGHNRALLLLDVVPLSLGLETYGDLMSALIPRNTRVPAVARETFTTFVDNQTGVDIHVLQGERERASDNRSLARFKLAGIEPQPAGFPRIEVSFLVDADGILQVAARDLKTGREQSVEVRPSFGLSDAEVERMLSASAEHAREDIDYRQLVEVRNEAEPVLRATEKAIQDKVFGQLPETEALAIRTDVEGLRAALSGTEPDAIRVASSRLSRSTARLAELILKESLNRAQQHSSRSPRS